MSEKKCSVCEHGEDATDHLLNDDEVREMAEQMVLWDLSEDGKKISRSFTAKNFQAALNFINEAGVIAEREGHHPDFHLTNYRDIMVDLSTFSASGLTQNDFVLASMLDDEILVR